MAKVLVVGATSAIASAMVERFATRGDRIFLVARNESKLKELVSQFATNVDGFCAGDFTNDEFAATAVAEASQVLNSIDIAILAHGYIGDQVQSEKDFSHSKEIIDVNYTSMVAFLIPISQQMLIQAKGKIAVMASVAGDRGRPRNYTYGSAKSALASYLSGLRSVLWGTGVEVYTFKLGPVVTPMTEDHKKNFSFSSINNVVETMLQALNGKRYVCYIPAFWFWVMLVVRNMPESIFQKVKFLSGR